MIRIVDHTHQSGAWDDHIYHTRFALNHQANISANSTLRKIILYALIIAFFAAFATQAVRMVEF